MSAFFSWQHAIRSSKLESTTKLVCYTIWSHMASDGTGCFPSYNLIAEESGLSKRAVILHVAKAVEAGFLAVEGRLRESGSTSTNLYRPTMPGGVHDVHPGGAPDALGEGAPNAPLIRDHLSNNPSKNTPLPPARFDEFWSAWPAHTRKVDRKGCERKWKAGGLDDKADYILVALEAFKASWDWRKNDGAFIPMPATWLHQERWDNAPAFAPAEETKPNF